MLLSKLSRGRGCRAGCRTVHRAIASKQPEPWLQQGPGSQHRHFHRASRLQSFEVKMPSLSPTMAEGQIVKWLKAEGEAVCAGDILCDIQTDKAVVSLETDEDGVLAKILKSEEDGTIKIGSLIAVIAEDGEDWKEAAASALTSPSSEDGAESVGSAPAETAGPTGGSTPGTEVKMPALSPTMSEGTIVKWCFKEGEKISAGDVLCEIQTDKAVVSMEVDDDCVLAKILIPEGTEGVKIGSLIAMTVDEGEDWQDVQIPAQTSTADDSSASAPPPPQASPAPSGVAA